MNHLLNYLEHNGILLCNQNPFLPALEDIVPEYSAHSTTSLSSRAEIQINKPIAFHVYYGYSDSQTSHTAYFPDYALEHPEKIDSDYAQIVAITFSDKPLS